MFALVVALAAAKPQYVSDYLDADHFSFLCTQDHCQESLKACTEGVGVGGKDCSKRMSCALKNGLSDKGLACFHGVTFETLENDEVQILECAKHNQCWQGPSGGASLLQVEMKKRDLMSETEKEEQRAKIALVQRGMNALDLKLMMTDKIAAAHSMYMDESERTLADNMLALKQISEDKDLDAETKLYAMEKVRGNIHKVQAGLVEMQSKIAKMTGRPFADALAERAEASSLVEVRPLSLLGEKSTSGAQASMTAAATQQMQDTLHKWEGDITEPSLIQAQNTDKSQAMVQQAQMEQTFEENFRRSYAEAMQKAHLGQRESNLRSDA